MSDLKTYKVFFEGHDGQKNMLYARAKSHADARRVGEDDSEVANVTKVEEVKRR